MANFKTIQRAKEKFDLPKKIGFRGRHQHGKGPHDPVYPLKKIPAELMPRVRSMQDSYRLADRRARDAVRGHVDAGSWRGPRKGAPDAQTSNQRGIIKLGPCSSRCGGSCAKSFDRPLCGWRVPGTVFEHMSNMDGIGNKYKGVVVLEDSIQKPLYRPLNQVAEKNPYLSEPIVMKEGKWEYVDREQGSPFAADPAFGIRHDLPPSEISSLRKKEGMHSAFGYQYEEPALPKDEWEAREEIEEMDEEDWKECALRNGCM